MAFRKCLNSNHEEEEARYFCTYPDCKFSRFICSQCLYEQTHQHGQQEIVHIMDEKKVLQNSQKNFDDVRKLLFRDLKKIQRLIEQFTIMTQLFVNSINSLQNQYEIKKEQVYILQQKSFTLLNEQEIMHLLESDTKINFIDQLKELQYRIDLIKQETLKYFEIQIQRQQYCQRLEKAKIQSINLDQIQDKSIQTADISQNLKYIALGGSENILKIWNYKTMNQIKQIPLENSILVCKFTNDSKYLYVGISGGALLQYETQTDFQQIYQCKAHSSGIVNILCITNFTILTSSWDKTIAKLNTQKREYLFQFKAHDDVICGLDYHRHQDLIITCSDDKSFKIWKENTLFLENQLAQRTHSVKQVRFLQDKDQFLCLDLMGIIKHWQIDFQNNSLIFIKQLTNKISLYMYNISLVLSEQYILVVGNQQILIYSITGQFIKRFEHEISKICHYNLVQSEYLKAVVVKGEKQCIVLQLQF